MTSVRGKFAIAVLAIGGAGQLGVPDSLDLFSQSLPTQAVQSEMHSNCQTISAATSQKAPLANVCEFATSLRGNLPKYVCEETVTRFEPSRLVDRHLNLMTDIIAAEVTFENGHDSYRNVTLNNKPTNQTIPELSGMSSAGEFGGLLQAIFKPESAAEFKFTKKHSLRSKQALVYAFRVAARNNKSWWLRVQESLTFPGYEGALWLNQATSELMRLEVRATEIPNGFPMAGIATTTDYANVQFSDGTRFPLAFKSETVARFNDKPFRNVVVYTNCREFAVTHQILLPE